MKSIFHKEAYEEILSRLAQLTADNQARWGKLTVSKMLVHCQKPIKLAFGEETVQKPNLMIRLMMGFVKPTLYNDKPWKQGLPTAKEFVIRDETDFNKEKENLKALIYRMHVSEDYFQPYKKHPIFGKLKPFMWGQSGYKHLDHHFKQFGV